MNECWSFRDNPLGDVGLPMVSFCRTKPQLLTSYPTPLLFLSNNHSLALAESWLWRVRRADTFAVYLRTSEEGAYQSVNSVCNSAPSSSSIPGEETLSESRINSRKEERDFHKFCFLPHQNCRTNYLSRTWTWGCRLMCWYHHAFLSLQTGTGPYLGEL